MKCKHTLAAAALAAVSLTVSGCSEKSFKNAYDMNTMRLADFNAGSLFYVKGFASDLCVPGNYEKLNTDGVDAEAFALFSLNDGEVISQQNIYERVYPASTTKILTCLIALENGDLSDTVTVPDSAAISVSGSSMANLKPGDKLTLSDLLYGLMVPSGNDAAETVAVYIAGSDEAFAELMNEKARSLGATQSHFTNPHGLPDTSHYTTPYDMYLIFNAAMKNETFREIASQKSHEARVTNASGETRTMRWTSSNQYLSGDFSLPAGISYTGGKTGHTADAGYCLVMSETADDGSNYISVVFKAASYQKLYDGTSALLTKTRK